MLDRFVEVRAFLEQLVSHDKWKQWARKKKVKRRAAAAEKLIKGSSYWKKGENLLKLLEYVTANMH